MSEAIATLKRTGKRRNFLYELPWYIIIGPPGAGKTTALVNSGSQVSTRRSGEAQPCRASAARAIATGGSPKKRC